MKRIKQNVLCTIVSAGLLYTAVCSSMLCVRAQDQTSPWSAHAKNVIIFIGSGMGPAQRELIRLATVGKAGMLAMDSMPYAGLAHTSSTSVVTDSAAAATAISTGQKTYNGAIGVDVNNAPLETILETAKKAGKATGIVTTSRLTDASSGAFGAHVESRNEQAAIARQLLDGGKVDVLLGGGKVSFITDTNLIEQAKEAGYTYVETGEQMLAAAGRKLLGLFAEEEMFIKGPEGSGVYQPDVTLPDMTRKAIELLSTEKNGFFLVIEEEAIDEMAHANNTNLVIKAGRQLDGAVAIAKDFASDNPDTLVIVTGDHETGGLSIEDVDSSDESGDLSPEDGPFPVANSTDQMTADWTTEGHTAVYVPVTAMGPGAEKLTGIYENTYIYDAMMEAMQLKK